MKRFLRYIFVTLTSLTLLVTIFVTLFFFQLSRGPVNLDFLKSHFGEKFLSKNDTLDFETLQLVWDNFNTPIRLEGLDIHYIQGDKKAREFILKKVKIHFPLRSLLHLKATPEKIVLDGLSMTINSFKGDIEEGHYKADLSFEKINSFMEQLLGLKTAHITNSTLVFKTQKTPVTLNLQAHLFNQNGALTGKIILKNQKGEGLIQSDLSYEKNAAALDISVTIDGFDAKTFDDVVPQVFLQNVTFDNIMLQGKYRYFLKTKKHEAHLIGALSQLDITHSDYWKAPLKFPNLSFSVDLTDHKFTIKEVATSVQGIPISATTTGVIDEHKDQIILETQVTVRDIPFKDLGKVWPVGAADGAREWITENITGGMAPKATLLMKSHLDFSGKEDFFTLDKLSGNIEVKGALLGYVETMPKVTNLMAEATFDHDHFDIKIKGGKTHGLTITSGKLFIGNFSDPTPRLELNINISGDLGDLLSLIDHRPLEYAKDYGLDPRTSSGKTQANLIMRFPLTSPFNPQSITTEVKANVKKARLHDLANLDVDLSEGDLKIDVGLKEVAVQGTARLNGEKSSLYLVQNVDTQLLDLKVKTDVTPESLNRLWHEAGVFFKGTAPLDLHYQVDGKKNGFLHIDLDLQKSDLNTLVMKKKNGVSGNLSFKGLYEGGSLREIESINFQDGQGWKITGRGDFFSKDHSLKKLHLTWRHKGKNIVTATFFPNKNGARFLDLKGSHIDIKNFMDTDLSALSDPQHLKVHPQDKSPFNIQLTAQKITVGRELGLLNNVLKLTMTDGLIQSLSYTGLTEEAIGNNRGVFAEIYKKKNGLRKLRIQTEQGGAFLRALDVFDNIRGGQFKLIAYHDPSFRKEEWVGKIRVRNFVLLNAPLLTRIFSLFPTGGAELTSGGGMKFNLMKVRFGASPKDFKVHASRAHGISVGFNLTGEIGRGKTGRLNLQGNMIPIYVLNTLVSKIPLIGEVIAGGKNEGLFSVSFGVSGTKEKPDVTANPLSIITPGITRNIFPSAQSSLTRDDGWIDDGDKDNDIFDQEFSEQ